jgi:hypothetical protein
MARVFISFVHEDDAVAMAVQALIAHELELEDEVFPPYASMQALDVPNDVGYLIESIHHHFTSTRRRRCRPTSWD